MNLLLFLENFLEDKERYQRVKNVFDREYGRKGLRSIEYVCAHIFDNDYDKWKGIDSFKDIIGHLKCTMQTKTLKLCRFVNALEMYGFTDTLKEIKDVYK